MMGVPSHLSRRQRLRDATVHEIKATARRLLVEDGPHSVTLRAIAREMGMTAPGLYRYFSSHEELLGALVVDLYDELCDVLVASRSQVGHDDAGCRLICASAAFRHWATTNPQEFALLFASPVRGQKPVPIPGEPIGAPHKAGVRFESTFTEIFVDLWQSRPFPVPPDDVLPPDLVRQLSAHRQRTGEQLGTDASTLPLTALNQFLVSWVELYGMVAMEVFQHLHFCLDNPEPFFAASLASIAERLGIRIPCGERGCVAGQLCDGSEDLPPVPEPR